MYWFTFNLQWPLTGLFLDPPRSYASATGFVRRVDLVRTDTCIVWVFSLCSSWLPRTFSRRTTSSGDAKVDESGMRKLLFTGVTKNSAGIEALKALKHQGVQRVCTVSCDSAVMPYALIHCKVTQRDCVLDDIWWLSKTLHFLLHLCTSLDFTQVTSSNCPSFVQLGFSLRISKTVINTRLREREKSIYIYYI